MNVAPALTARRRWSALWVLFAAQMFAIGGLSYGYGLLIKPLSEEFALSRSQAGSGFQIWLLGTAIWSPFVGIALQRLSAHLVIAIGASLFASGMVIAAWSHTLAVSAAATFLLIASGSAAIGTVPGSTLVARWFATGQGRALGIIAVSASAGGFLLSPILARSIEQIGWRSTVMVMGVFVGVSTILSAFAFLRGLPRNPVVDRDASPVNAAGAKPLMVRQILCTRDFWLLVFVIGTMVALTQGILTSIVPYGEDKGLKTSQAAILVSVFSGSSVTGKLITGWLSEYFDPRLMQLAAVGLMAGFFITILMDPSYLLMMLACAFGGASVGASTLLWPVLVGMRFGVGSIGVVLGLMVLMQMPLLLGCVQFVGVAFDRWQSYQPAYAAFLLILPFVAIAVLRVRRPASDPVVQRGSLAVDRSGGERAPQSSL